jgi:hypothetical protein
MAVMGAFGLMQEGWDCDNHVPCKKLCKSGKYDGNIFMYDRVLKIFILDGEFNMFLFHAC